MVRGDNSDKPVLNEQVSMVDRVNMPKADDFCTPCRLTGGEVHEQEEMF